MITNIPLKALLAAQLKGVLLLVAYGAFLATACSPRTTPQSSAALSQGSFSGLAPRLEKMADSLAMARIQAGASPALSIAIAKNDTIIFAKGYGKADVTANLLAQPQTVYGITSITKQFTAVAILKLVEQGKISLDEPISTYLPDYPLQGRQVTVRHLLNHTSGIASMRSTSSVEKESWFSQDLTYSEMVDLFGTQAFEFEPGQKHAYNNFAYYLLGEIISQVASTPWDQYLQQEIFEPFELNHTQVCDARSTLAGIAKAYVVREGEAKEAPLVSKQVLGAAGALCSTAEDLVRWSYLLHQGKIISPASLKQLLASTVLSSGDTVAYGFGLYLGELEGRQKVYHGGSLPWGSYLAHYPESGLTIAVLTNSAKAGREIGEEIELAMAKTAFNIQTLRLPLSAKEMLHYEGSYQLKVGERTLDVRIYRENGQLNAQAEGQRPSPLLYQGNNNFAFAVDNTIRLSFSMANERAESFILLQNGREIVAQRKSLEESDPLK